jgi:glycerol-3-phosphate dehydrogenase
MHSRPEALSQIEGKTFDVCVIGGGATGAGCALDAQLRGLRTVLLEAHDFASAASGASTKLAHGGVRYLEQAVTKFDPERFRMVRVALRERLLMLRNAPYLARPIELLVPCLRWSEVLYFEAGMKIYDWIAGAAGIARSHYVSRDESVRRLPLLKADGLLGTISYSDGQFDDARYNVALVESFVAAGGMALNHATVTSFESAAVADPAATAAQKLTGARVRDELSLRTFVVRARVFVNATGAVSDSTRRLANPNLTKRLNPSKGVHALFPLENFSQGAALLVPKTDDGRVVFAIPWGGRLLVGTTETDSVDDKLVRREDIEFLLRQINRYLRRPLKLEEAVSGFAGLRPLIGTSDVQSTSELSRDHEVEVDSNSGLISILGGKWTTYRAMAEDTIDAVQHALGLKVSQCLTAEHGLAGSTGCYPELWEHLVRTFDVEAETARHLVGKYGSQAEQVLRIAHENEELRAPIVSGLPFIHAELVFVIRHEMASTIEDVLARRLGFQLMGWRSAIQAAPVTAEHLARELGWSAEQRGLAVEEYVARLNMFLEAAGLAAESPNIIRS